MVQYKHLTASKSLCYTAFFKKIKATGKIFNMLKPKSYLSKLDDIACHVTYYLSKTSEQLLSCKLFSRTTPSIIKLGTNRLWLETTYAMDMVLLCKHKGVVL